MSSFWIRYLVSGFDSGISRGFLQFLRDVARGELLTPELFLVRVGTDWASLESGFRVWVRLQFIRPPGENSPSSP